MTIFHFIIPTNNIRHIITMWILAHSFKPSYNIYSVRINWLV